MSQSGSVIPNPTSPLGASRTLPTAGNSSSDSSVTPGMSNPLDVLRMAMTSFFASPASSSNVTGTTLGETSTNCIAPNDPAIAKYVQGIKDLELRRHIQLWVARGTPEITAHRSAEMYVQRVYENGPQSVYLYLAAVRAMRTDVLAGGNQYDASIKQGSLDLYSRVAAMGGSYNHPYQPNQHQHFHPPANSTPPPTWQQAYLASSTLPPYQLPCLSTDGMACSSGEGGGSHHSAPRRIESTGLNWKRSNTDMLEAGVSSSAPNTLSSPLSSSSSSSPYPNLSRSPNLHRPPPPSDKAASDDVVRSALGGEERRNGLSSSTFTGSVGDDKSVSMSFSRQLPLSGPQDDQSNDLLVPGNINPSSFLKESGRSWSDVVIESTSPATRILAQRWIRNTFTSLENAKPPSSKISSAEEWLSRLVAFLKLIAEGQRRQAEEGAAMRWLTLPTPTVEFVIEVTDNLEMYKDVLPGYHEIQDETTSNVHSPRPASDSRVGHPSDLFGASGTLRRGKSIWVPPQLSSISSPGRGNIGGGEYGEHRDHSNYVSFKNAAKIPKKVPLGSRNRMVEPPAVASSHSVETFIPVSGSLGASLSTRLDKKYSLASAGGGSLQTPHRNSKKGLGNNPLLSADLEAANLSFDSLAEASILVNSSKAKRTKLDSDEKKKRQNRARRFLYVDSSAEQEHSSVRLVASTMKCESTIPAGLFLQQEAQQYSFPHYDNSLVFKNGFQSPHRNANKLVGLSTVYEKKYLRLCGPPDPNLVRSEDILVEAFFFVTEKFVARVNAASRERTPSPSISAVSDESGLLRPDSEGDLIAHYRYVEEQLRSIRQDFAVQAIKSPFLYMIYSINSRISQIFHDLGQFNQCHSQLKQLEKSFLTGFEDDTKFVVVELLVYRLLYAAINNLDAEFHKLEQTAVRLLRRPNLSEEDDLAIRYVLNLRRSLVEQNYSRFLKLAVAVRRTRSGRTLRQQETFPTHNLREVRINELRVVELVVQSFKNRWKGAFHELSSSSDISTIESQMESIKESFVHGWKNYNKNNKFLSCAPYLCHSLLRVPLSRFRMLYLCTLARSHYVMDVEEIHHWLRTSTVEECRTFLGQQRAVFTDARQCSVDCSQTLPLFLQSSLLSRKVQAMG